MDSTFPAIPTVFHRADWTTSVDGGRCAVVFARRITYVLGGMGLELGSLLAGSWSPCIPLTGGLLCARSLRSRILPRAPQTPK